MLYKKQVLKIDNLINELSDRSKATFSLAFDLASNNETNLNSFHILYVLLNDADQYISDMLIALTPNLDRLRSDVFSLSGFPLGGV